MPMEVGFFSHPCTPVGKESPGEGKVGMTTYGLVRSSGHPTCLGSKCSD